MERYTQEQDKGAFSSASRRSCCSCVLWRSAIGFFGSKEPSGDRSVTRKTAGMEIPPHNSGKKGVQHVDK